MLIIPWSVIPMSPWKTFRSLFLHASISMVRSRTVTNTSITSITSISAIPLQPAGFAEIPGHQQSEARFWWRTWLLDGSAWTSFWHKKWHDMGVGQNLLLSILMGWTSIYQLFWGSLGARVLTDSHMTWSVVSKAIWLSDFGSTRSACLSLCRSDDPMVKSSLVPREAPGALNVELSVVRQLGVGGCLTLYN